MITVEVHTEDFEGWIDSVKYGFMGMMETMIRVAELVKEETQPITPLETGKLSRSFKWTILADNSRFKTVEVQMSALNIRTGYDYAMTQHRGYHISKTGKVVKYNHGVDFLGFGNAVQDQDTGKWDLIPSSSIDINHQGTSFYLLKGIYRAEEGAFELIEEDYLSLFTRGEIH